jgi:hypothetical protein
MPKRTSDQLRYWSQTHKIIGEQLRFACPKSGAAARIAANIAKLPELLR